MVGDEPRDWLEDLRHRAAVIEGFAHLLAAGVAPEQAAEHARRILEQSLALRRLLGSTEEAPAATDLGRLVRGAVEAMSCRTHLTALLADISRQAPPGATVEVDVRGEGGWAEVVVHRPGLAPCGDVVVDLYRSRAVAREHGGELTVAEEDGGMRVTLRLPLGRSGVSGR